MSNPKRRDEKKRRREKRQTQRDRSKSSLEGVLKTLQRLCGFPEPRSWPGAADPSLSRPDVIKYELTSLTEHGTGHDLRKQLEVRLKQGFIHFLPDLDHWGMEEFFWHGLPGNSWHPIDRFLQLNEARFPDAVRVQLRRWKDARIGCYEVGAVTDDLVSLREVDVFTGRPVGDWVRAIALNIGGVNVYGPEKGKINVTYLAPWAPERNIFCAMGYGLFIPPKELPAATLLVRGMRSIAAVTFPLPWQTGKLAAQQCFQQWRDRNWLQFMQHHVRCPFEACLVREEGPQLCVVSRMATSSMAEYEEFGLYFAVDEQAKMLCGATAIVPLDFDSPNSLAFAEYREFRRIAGPPPASRGRI